MAILSTPLQYLQSIPTTTRWFSAATLAFSLGYLILLSPQPAPALLFVPESSIFYPWSFLTSGIVEPSIIGVRRSYFTEVVLLTDILQLIVTLVCVPPFLGYLERVWGSMETLKFILVTLVIPNFMTFAVCWIEYLILAAPSVM